MRAIAVKAVILTNDNEEVTHVAFSKDSAYMFVSVQEAYAGDNPTKLAEIKEAKTVIESAELPAKKTPYDLHYCRAMSMSDTVTYAQKQFTTEIIPDETFGKVLCYFITGGQHGLDLAFSKEATREMIIPNVSNGVSDQEAQFYNLVINGSFLPFPDKKTGLDRRFREMVASYRQAHR